ncbi:MAG TPA: ABC transporter ATP-binding protein [Acidimicrobiia bacterium]
MPVLEVRGLRFSYPDGREALRGVDLTVAEGERVALLGPNGAGKTTLALHLNGLLRGASGEVLVGGVSLTDDTVTEIRRRVGLVFQDPNDQLFMPTVADDVAFGPANLGVRGRDLDAVVEEALHRVGASDLASRPPHHLSGGEKRLAALATVLAMGPEILVLDEPGSGLDPAGRRTLIETLSVLDVTMVVITHDLPLALELCPRSVVMDGGRVVVDMPTPELLSRPDLLAEHRLELPYGFTLAHD